MESTSKSIVSTLITLLLFVKTIATIESDLVFKKEQVIFSSSFNITQLLVPSDGITYVHGDFSDIPSIFFTITDPRLEGGSCIYVLEGLAAYEVLEGGRDTTSDYGQDKSVYFGANNGVYRYDPASLSAKKYGPFNDDIIQIQKANNSDVIYFLNSEKKLYTLEKNGTVKKRLRNIVCASEFVLDTTNNIYYISCEDGLPHIVKADGVVNSYTASVMEDFKDVKLLRPAFVMDRCIPFIGDGNLYILYANGTSVKKNLHFKEKPTAYSVDAALYLVAALNGKIYEFNVMEGLLNSMFGVTYGWPRDITTIITSIMDTAKDGMFKEWNAIIY